LAAVLAFVKDSSICTKPDNPGD